MHAIILISAQVNRLTSSGYSSFGLAKKRAMANLTIGQIKYSVIAGAIIGGIKVALVAAANCRIQASGLEKIVAMFALCCYVSELALLSLGFCYNLSSNKKRRKKVKRVTG